MRLSVARSGQKVLNPTSALSTQRDYRGSNAHLSDLAILCIRPTRSATLDMMQQAGLDALTSCSPYKAALVELAHNHGPSLKKRRLTLAGFI